MDNIWVCAPDEANLTPDFNPDEVARNSFESFSSQIQEDPGILLQIGRIYDGLSAISDLAQRVLPNEFKFWEPEKGNFEGTKFNYESPDLPTLESPIFG
ncbi:MAG: hypothetical protein SFU25_09080 [Candidatus Caenarcaniphilales bacterium]|nr:hypothetical protein [Candidatus Caenarcaniphilales bacterium]